MCPCCSWQRSSTVLAGAAAIAEELDKLATVVHKVEHGKGLYQIRAKNKIMGQVTIGRIGNDAKAAAHILRLLAAGGCSKVDITAAKQQLLGIIEADQS